MSGRPILAIDPHIGFSLPGIWYEAHIKTPNFEIYGHFLPGAPFPILGHNQNYGWAITMSEVDDMDFYREELDDTGKKAFINGEWEDLKFERNVVKVRGEDDYAFDLPISSHGPFMDEVLKEDKGIALKWTFHHPDNNIVEAMYGMGVASNMSQFKKSLSMAAAPGLNISYADREGNIGWWVFGKIPLRPQGVKNDFLLSGSSGNDEYLGYENFENNPHLENPPNGSIVTANYRPYGSARHIHGSWEPDDRVKTIESVLSKKERWSVDEVKSLQVANINIEISWIKPILLNSLLESLDEKKSRKYQPFYKMLAKWKGESSTESAAATLYHQWNREIILLVLDELDEKEKKIYCSLPARWHFYKRLLKNPNNPWWNMVSTKRNENMADIVLKAFDAAILKLTTKLGPDFSKWKWGDLHTVSYIHPVGRHKFFAPFLNEGPFPAPGGYNQINNMRAVGCHGGFKVKAGPSTRRVVDFYNPKKSWGILPLGLSGHKFSPFYNNQMEDFLKGEHRPQIMGIKEINKNKYATLIFHPQKE